MANRLRKVPSVTRRPGVPGVPPTPAYCVLEPVYSDFGAYAETLSMVVRLTEQAYRASVGSTYWGQIGQDARGTTVYGVKTVNITDFSRAFFGPSSGNAVPRVLGYAQTCYPATPGVPAIPPATSFSAQTGWNSGGRSIGGFSGDGYAQFTIAPDAIGVVVGINTGLDTNSPADCSHAFYAANGDLSVFERGVLVQSVVADLVARPELRIVRTAGSITYFVDGAPVYTSATPSAGYARIDAALYVAGDYVDDPMVGIAQRAAATTSVGVVAFIDARNRASASVGVTATARGRAGSTYRATATTRVGVIAQSTGNATNFAAATGRVGVQVQASNAKNTVHTRVPALAVLAADTAYSFVDARYSGGYQVDSQGGFPEIQFAGVFALAPKPAVFSYGQSGGIGAVAAVGPTPTAISADYAYAQVTANYQGSYFAQSYEPWLSPNAVFWSEVIFAAGEFTPFVAVHAAFSSVVSVGDNLTVELELSDGFEWLEALMASATFAELSDKSAEFFDAVHVTDQTMDGGSSARQVVSNTLTAAATTYNGFDFLSLHHLGRMGSYAVRADGVYRVAGGGLVSAMVDTGSSSFGGYAPKRLEAIYIGMRTDGDVIAVVQAEDETDRTYRVIQRPDYMRVSPAKGESSKSWRLRLELTDAQAGDVDVIQFVVSEQSRRWSR